MIITSKIILFLTFSSTRYFFLVDLD